VRRLWLLRLLGWACVLGALHTPHVTHAQSRLDFALELRAPAAAACTSQAGLEQAIEARVERLVFLGNAEPARRIHVQVTQDAAAATWSSTIVMHNERGEVVGERRLRTPQGACSELDDALVVVISTLIGIADPAPASAAQEEQEEPAEARAAHATSEGAAEAEGDTPVSAGEASRASEPADADAPRALVLASTSGPDSPEVPTELNLDIGLRGDLGYLPGLALGIAADLRIDLGSWALAFGGSYWPYTHRELDFGAGATLWSLAGGASLCFEVGQAVSTKLALCSGLEAGFIRVVVTGLGKNQDPYAPIVRVRFGPAAYVALSQTLGAVLDLDAVVPLLTPHYYFIEAGGQRRYYHSVGLGISMTLGMYWLFSS
jgi:hypothetical protein